MHNIIEIIPTIKLYFLKNKYTARLFLLKNETLVNPLTKINEKAIVDVLNIPYPTLYKATLEKSSNLDISTTSALSYK